MTGIEGLSALEIAMRQRPRASPEDVIQDLAADLVDLGEVTRPPVDLRLLASIQAIVDVEETIDTFSGCLINKDGQLRVQLNALESLPRQNFTLGHEICHTLLPGFTLSTNFRCTPGRSTPRQSRQLDVEWLADVGASELVLPRRLVTKDFAERPFGWDALEAVSNLYAASLEATARRFVRLSAAPAFFVRLQFGTSKTNPRPELRVRHASWSRHLNIFIPPKKSVPRTHPIFRATEGELVDEVADMACLRAPGQFRVSARPYPYFDNQKGEDVLRVLAVGVNSPTRKEKRP
ncbi:ImmA/IrrE family metallo-endopeptidase [Mumia zhuanghuii]|uniref:ImmA/IrrE family metallo-endopeptidase n=2 Tax=Mumia TaxID=1546255 RepID=A0ABW1QJQ7_9ACTN|nr:MULTISPECIES: ImmA/IrrE family metallo-endopeptidase [Mumia]KAA1418137.1 ImmA/IrrE family metallo-endopeptidase [Mumia zhuanghuii]